MKTKERLTLRGVCFALLAVNSVSALIDRTEERLYRLLHRLPSERKEAAE